MTENIPPAGNSNFQSSDAQTRGLPYYEKLKKDLREILTKKRQLDKTMAALEDQIFRCETSYLEETTAGNIIKGFDNYVKGTTAAGTASTGGGGGGGGGGTSTRRKAGQDLDRVFSRSSTSFMRELSPPSSAQVSPPGGTPTSASSTKGGGNQKGRKRGEREEPEDDGKGPKRLKITYARGGVGD